MKKTRLVPVLILGGFLLGCAGSDWETNLPTTACVDRARLALRDADFNENTDVVGDREIAVVLAEHGAYRARLTCANGGIRFLVVGPDYHQSLWYKDTIIRKF